MKHIAILVHQQDRLEADRYLMHDLADIWREEGFQVSIAQGPTATPDADIAILHVDLTIIPQDYLNLITRYPRVLNSNVNNISKRLISKNVLSRNDSYNGPVIVKTNRNSGGERERLLDTKTSRLKRSIRALRDRLPWAWRSRISGMNYPIFESLAQVPKAAWYNSDFVIERFTPERQDDLYCLRTWVFLGDRDIHALSFSKNPIVKSENVIRRQTLDHVPEQLQKIRQDLGFDYGKFDYALVDGQVILFDANRTPTMGRLPRDQYRPRAVHLAQGIRKYL